MDSRFILSGGQNNISAALLIFAGLNLLAGICHLAVLDFMVVPVLVAVLYPLSLLIPVYASFDRQAGTLTFTKFFLLKFQAAHTREITALVLADGKGTDLPYVLSAELESGKRLELMQSVDFFLIARKAREAASFMGFTVRDMREESQRVEALTFYEAGRETGPVPAEASITEREEPGGILISAAMKVKDELFSQGSHCSRCRAMATGLFAFCVIISIAIVTGFFLKQTVMSYHYIDNRALTFLFTVVLPLALLADLAGAFWLFRLLQIEERIEMLISCDSLTLHTTSPVTLKFPEIERVKATGTHKSLAEHALYLNEAYLGIKLKGSDTVYSVSGFDRGTVSELERLIKKNARSLAEAARE